ncbi:MAG: NAD-dependent DNA ligase LigA [Enterocloster asparagiformis]|nr:NAD-dependent DNA ligase LigA [Enterocloster asparagiformis]
MDNIERIKKLTDQLNMYRNFYYNKNISIVSDFEYDSLLDELTDLEQTEGVIFSNSPTQSVGFEVVSELQKVNHAHPMLSLNKTKSVDELKSFIGTRPGVLMAKMDGLTIGATYEKGKLIRLETRGDSEVGEDITHNAGSILDLPLTIPVDHAEICGEAIVRWDDFKMINEMLPVDDRFSTPRNMAAGAVRQHDSSICAARKVRFVAWKIVEPEPPLFSQELEKLRSLGFTVVPHLAISDSENLEILEQTIDPVRLECNKLHYPIDGEVLRFNDTSYANSLGRTRKYFRSAMAFKFYDEEERTRLIDVEWSMGRTGVLTPVAVFNTVVIDGTSVNRASIHNVSIFKALELGYNDEITVYKANMIIPQIRENLSKTGTCQIPTICPICGEKLEIVKDHDTEILRCTNNDCSGKVLKRLENFVRRDAMNIDGLSTATLSTFVDFGWINEPIDIYRLAKHAEEMIFLEGYGEKSVKKLLESIEKSKTCTMTQFLTACGIPGVGRAQSGLIADYFDNNWSSFSSADYSALMNINGIGVKTADNIWKWLQSIYKDSGFYELANILEFKKTRKASELQFAGKTFCITGKLNIYKNRRDLVTDIEIHGGKVTNTVSKSTDFLIANDKMSNTGKTQSAKEAGINIITEDEFIKMITKN